MSHLVRLELKEGLARHLRAGHPWVFKKGLAQLPRLEVRRAERRQPSPSE